MWRDQSGMMEMLLAYIGEYEDSRDWMSWRSVLVDILSCHENLRRKRVSKFEEDNNKKDIDVEIKIKSEDAEEHEETAFNVESMTALRGEMAMEASFMQQNSRLHEDVKAGDVYPESVEDGNGEELNSRFPTSSFDTRVVEQLQDDEVWIDLSPQSQLEMSGQIDFADMRKKEFHYCNFCGKAFAQRNKKIIHERTHTGVRPFSCSYCGKTFMNNGSKTRHERIHTGEKPFSCSYCPSSFKTSFEKKQHERTHTGETPFQCSFCDRKFRFLTSRKLHERTHMKASNVIQSR